MSPGTGFQRFSTYIDEYPQNGGHGAREAHGGCGGHGGLEYPARFQPYIVGANRG